MRAILNVLNERKFVDKEMEFDFEEKVKIYLKNSGNIKLRPVEYDRACFDTLIIDNQDYFSTATPSQKRIKEAKEYFEKELKTFGTVKLLDILEKLESTGLTVIELEGKKDSALMFELENNRGKDLTNMEKLKSYFMYQMYICSNPEEVEINIENISNIFKLIYLIINDLNKTNEDSILIYHNNAYIKGFAYRNLDDLKEVYKKSTNKVEWIKLYAQDLHTSFSNIKKFENATNEYALRLKELDTPAYIYPFIIKGYKYFDRDPEKLNTLFNLLEIITFRARLINSRANIQERLNTLLLEFNGDLPALILKVKNKLNESWYWGDNNTKSYLNGFMYGSIVVNYLLWRYEHSIQNRGYGINNFMIDNEQIEHISPQTPTDEEPIKTGYEVNDKYQYSEEFISSELNCIGNLMLISGSHNASIGNKPFKDKLLTYIRNPLLNQQAEIEKFATKENDEPFWKGVSIKSRHSKLTKFALEEWSFDRIIEV